jgi:uncharacterized protein Smg (DUF494 family)
MRGNKNLEKALMMLELLVNDVKSVDSMSYKSTLVNIRFYLKLEIEQMGGE